ncbi:MAG TPA: BTAD domain-containing putative transcriptional regulator, partial [Micromonospora sp.]
MHHLWIRCLGALEVVAGDRTLSCGGPLQRGLLALLLINANQVVGVDRIMNGLWDRPPETALGQVQTRIWRLRRLLRDGPGVDVGVRPQLVTRGGGYGLLIEPETVDVAVFDRRVARATALAADDRPHEAAAELREALALWRGPAFADVPAPGVRAEACAVEERRLAAIEQRVEIELRLGLHAQLVPELMDLVAAHPFREGLRCHLMRALHQCGRRAEAVQVYLEGYRAMVDALGLEPGRELRDLHRSILLCDDRTGGSREAPPAVLVTTPRELPRDPVCLVGRERLTTDLYDLLRPTGIGTGAPVAVLSGVAGVGKSALAVRVA